MSLFPAYAPDGGESLKVQDTIPLKRQRTVMEVEQEAQEAELLASDPEEQEPTIQTPVLPPTSTLPPSDEPFYVDKKADKANLHVTTLYYPGRPIYQRSSVRSAGAGAEGRTRRRYHLQSGAVAGTGEGTAQVVERASALRRLISEQPRDEELWLRYVHFQEEWADVAAWRAAAEEARDKLTTSPRLRAALHRARTAALPPRDLLAAISEDLAKEKGEEPQLDGWLRLLWTLGGAGGSPAEVERATAAALQALQHSPRAYPLLLYACGAALRSAGLWERLVLLLELVVAVNLPATSVFPPKRSPDEERAAELRLQEVEDAVIDSGLPLSTVWVRVERLRAAAHWRAVDGAEDAQLDPQRAPAAGTLAPLLAAARSGGALLLQVSALRLAGVPLLPVSEAVRTAIGAGDHEAAEPTAAAMLALVRARRRIPTATHSPGELRAALAALLDPPHIFGDDAGFGAWVSALWEASCASSDANRRLALVCWRLRWLHALVLTSPPDEARSLRAQARRLLKSHARDEPLAYALFARIEAAAGDKENARRAALQAARAACSLRRPIHALFVARVLQELLGERDSSSRWALISAVQCRPLPPPEALIEPLPVDELRAALQECSLRCEEEEQRLSTGGEEPDAAVIRAFTCGAGEWAAARARLQEPVDRRADLHRLLELGYERVHRSAESVQYWESAAVALAEAAGAARGAVARQLRSLFPNNALLALASAGWEECGHRARTHTEALAMSLPVLTVAPWVAGVGVDDTERKWERVARVLARAARGGAGGAALSALRLAAETRAERRVLLAALADLPNDKWLYIRGAARVPAEAEALCDAALERGLRTHALLHELRAPPATHA